MSSTINRLTVVMEQMAPYFKPQANFILWAECKREFRHLAEIHEISSLSIDEKSQSLNFMEQVESTTLLQGEWIKKTITLQDYWQKQFAKKISWILSNIRKIKKPTKAEIQQYNLFVESLTERTTQQSSLKYRKDLLHLLRNLDIFEGANIDRFLIAGKYDSDKIERVYHGLYKLKVIDCAYSDFKNLFRDRNFKIHRSKVMASPINWLKYKTSFGYIFSLIVQHFEIEGYDIKKMKISNKLWEFADNFILYRGKAGEWSKKKEKTKPGEIQDEIDNIFSTL